MIDVATDELIPMDAVAKRYGVAYRTVMTWPQRLGLEAVRLGGRVYTTAAALNAIAQQKGEGSRQQAAGSEEPTANSQQLTARAARREHSPATLAAAARHGVLLS